MIIDFHTHAFPDSLATGTLSKLVSNAQAYAHLYGGSQPYTDGTLDGLADSSRQAGIDISLILPVATSPKPSQTLNTFAVMADRHEGLRSFGSVHPQNPDCMKELERIQSLGLRGIKLHPDYQGCFADGADTIAVVRKATELGLWVIFHAGVDIGMPPPIHCTPQRIIRLRKAVPDARIILAHMGGFFMWPDVLSALPDMQVWIDTSYSLTKYPQYDELFAKIIRANGTGHVLFGTDSPWANQKESLEMTKAFFKRFGFTPTETASMLGDNAQRILDNI